MKYKCVLLVVKDIDISRKLYQDILGLTLEHDLEENISFKEGIALHQKSHFESLLEKTVNLDKNHTHELYFEEDDIEKAYELIQSENLTFNHGIMEQPWLQRVFRFYDYDQHLIEIGENMSAVVRRLRQYYDDKIIAEKIGMPLSFVAGVS